MKKVSILIFLTLLFHNVFGQTRQLIGLEGERNLQEIGNSNKLSGVVQTFDNRYEGIKGTPFFLENWGLADVTIEGNQLFTSVPLKYNVLENSLLYKKANGLVYELEPYSVVSFILRDSVGQEIYEFKKIPDINASEPKAAHQFYLVLFDGVKTQLALAQDKTIVKADFKGGYSPNIRYDEIVSENVYYLVRADSAPEKVKLSKKHLLVALNDQKAAVETFLKKNKIDARTESGWVKTLRYYDTL